MGITDPLLPSKSRLLKNLNSVGFDQFMRQQVMAVIVAPILAGSVALITTLYWPAAALLAVGLSGTVTNVIVWTSGIAFGYAVSGLASRGVEMARWVWIAPTVILILLFAVEANRFGLHAALAGYFGIDAHDEEAIGLLFTLPVVSAIGYSIGAWIRFWTSAKPEPARQLTL